MANPTITTLFLYHFKSFTIPSSGPFWLLRGACAPSPLPTGLVLEHLHKSQQFKRKETRSIDEYFVQLVAKANKAFPGASAAEIGKHVVDTFALNVSDTKLTAKVIAHRDTLTLEQLGKLVLEKEQARSLASTIGVDVKTEPSENLSVEPKLVDVKQETQVAALCERVADLEREMGVVGKERTVSLEDQIAQLEAFQDKIRGPQRRATRLVECRNCHMQGHYMRECPVITAVAICRAQPNATVKSRETSWGSE